ncbi:MAG: hypothetical protein FJ253_00450 [Phycisphaerae bacterium]|nr:hypothetical protein [Phycisphaerae bacterium]
MSIEDAFDLFLDALANTLGVVMFIALMVVLFAAPPERPERTRDDPPSVDPDEARQVRALLAQAAEFERMLASAPLEGDPVLRARAEALLDEMHRQREEISRALSDTAEAADEVARLSNERERARRETQSLDERRRSVEQRIAEAAATSSFVRVSRFRDDPRTPVLLLLSKGALERAVPAPNERRILPGSRTPREIRSVESARDALDSLLTGVSPATHRIEVGVWNDSFAEYKLLERQLIDRGFDLNPLPVRAGDALESGAGGVQ